MLNEVAMSNRVAVLSGHSLFAEGIISRLREHQTWLEVHHINPDNSGYLDRIKQIQPTAVLIDAADEDGNQCGFLCELLLTFPTTTIVRLAADQRDVQVIHSSTHQFSGVGELMDVLEDGSKNTL
jgi:DNA-binding NarL/FixJ family response regulator